MIDVPARIPSPTCKSGRRKIDPDNALAAGAERHANANLTRASRDSERQHGVDPGERQHQCHPDITMVMRSHSPMTHRMPLLTSSARWKSTSRSAGSTAVATLAKLRGEHHRIAAPHVHHHVDPVEEIRRAGNVEASRTSPPRRRRPRRALSRHRRSRTTDSAPRDRAAGKAHLLADGISPLQHLVHKPLIDDRDSRAGAGIGRVERATGENGCLQHVEIRRIDRRDRRFAERRRCIRARRGARATCLVWRRSPSR